jgi:spore germination protein GerM
VARSKKRRTKKQKRTWIWKAISVVAFLYLVGLGVVWLRDFNFWKEPDPTSRQIAPIQLFFSNSEQDPDALDCGAVFPVSRELPPNPSVARMALTELLKGPTAEESAQGFYSSINEGVRLQGLDIRDGVAIIDFDRTFAAEVAGSCQVEAIRAQVTQTLAQFPSVNSVVITVAGEISESFQP